MSVARTGVDVVHSSGAHVAAELGTEVMTARNCFGADALHLAHNMDTRAYAFLAEQAHSTLLQRALEALGHSSRGPVKAPLSTLQSSATAHLQNSPPVPTKPVHTVIAARPQACPTPALGAEARGSNAALSQDLQGSGVGSGGASAEPVEAGAAQPEDEEWSPDSAPLQRLGSRKRSVKLPADVGHSSRGDQLSPEERRVMRRRLTNRASAQRVQQRAQSKLHSARQQADELHRENQTLRQQMSALQDSILVATRSAAAWQGKAQLAHTMNNAMYQSVTLGSWPQLGDPPPAGGSGATPCHPPWASHQPPAHLHTSHAELYLAALAMATPAATSPGPEGFDPNPCQTAQAQTPHLLSSHSMPHPNASKIFPQGPPAPTGDPPRSNQAAASSPRQDLPGPRHLQVRTGQQTPTQSQDVLLPTISSLQHDAVHGQGLCSPTAGMREAPTPISLARHAAPRLDDLRTAASAPGNLQLMHADAPSFDALAPTESLPIGLGALAAGGSPAGMAGEPFADYIQAALDNIFGEGGLDPAFDP